MDAIPTVPLPSQVKQPAAGPNPFRPPTFLPPPLPFEPHAPPIQHGAVGEGTQSLVGLRAKRARTSTSAVSDMYVGGGESDSDGGTGGGDWAMESAHPSSDESDSDHSTGRKRKGKRTTSKRGRGGRGPGRPSKRRKLPTATGNALDEAAAMVAQPATYMQLTTPASAFPSHMPAAAATMPPSAYHMQSATGIVHLTPTEQKELLAQSKKKGLPEGKSYNRKEKSLGLLCENFVKMYSAGIGSEICLDSAATNLGVERRRIYDIVNILESVDIVSRRGKNQYIWHGTTRLANAIRTLESAVVGSGHGFQQVPVDLLGIHSFDSHQPVRMAPQTQQIMFGHGYEAEEGAKKKKAIGSSKQEQTLGYLSQVFLQMFLSNDTRIVSLDDAGKWLLGGPQAKPGETEAKAASNFKSRVRRLYDIANVFTSLELIEKIHITQTRKPAFKWLGARVYPLLSTVPREAYTLDAPSRRPVTKVGFDAMFPAPIFPPPAMATAAQAMPPSVPRRATIDTALLAANAKAAQPSPSADLLLSNVPGAASLVPSSLGSLSRLFAQFESIQKNRTIDQPMPATTTKKPTTKKVEIKIEPQSAALSERTTSAAMDEQHQSILQIAATGSTPAIPFDPLLLAYARIPTIPVGVPCESTADLTDYVGFPLFSSSYIRDGSSWLRQYREVCGQWALNIPQRKSMFLKHALAPSTTNANGTQTK